MKYTTLIIVFVFSLWQYSLAQHTNVLISSQNEPEEVSIVINPNNTNQLVAGANINNYYYSGDGGQTWSSALLSSTYGVWGDPVVIVDTANSFYFLHLSNPQVGAWLDRIVCQKSTNGGMTWNNGSYMTLDSTKAHDKHWAAIDRHNNNIYVTWTQFDSYGSTNQTDSSHILFSRSLNAGQSWSTPIRINKLGGDCIDDDNTVEGAVPAIGTNGEVYVAWAGPQGIMFDKSLNYGQTWLTNDIFVSSQSGGWAYSIPGIYRANGLPITACDTSNSPYRGTIYINWSDQRNGETNTDVWLAKSTNDGETWSQAVKVNDDSSNHQQFFTWMSIDQVTGYLYFVFYDRRNYEDNRTDVYMAVSKDGGNTFSNFKVSESPFLPNGGVFFGDYIGVTAHNNVIRPIWMRLQSTHLSVWTALIDETAVGINNIELDSPYLDQNSPNPFHNKTYFSFKLRKQSNVSLQVFDVLGNQIATILTNTTLPAGKYTESFDAHQYNLQSGVYYFSLTTNEKILVKKMILVE